MTLRWPYLTLRWSSLNIEIALTWLDIDTTLNWHRDDNEIFAVLVLRWHWLEIKNDIGLALRWYLLDIGCSYKWLENIYFCKILGKFWKFFGKRKSLGKFKEFLRELLIKVLVKMLLVLRKFRSFQEMLNNFWNWKKFLLWRTCNFSEIFDYLSWNFEGALKKLIMRHFEII